MFEMTALETALAGTMYAGKLHYDAVTGSTNTNALLAARAGAAEGTVFFADEQTEGRGRGGNAWRSAAGEGLYVSVVLRPQFPALRLPLLPLAAGLAAMRAIDEVTGLRADLRWPNDLLLGERKTGGILMEAHTERNTAAFVAVGIGINVHQREFAPGLSTPGTSLDVESGRSISRQALMTALLKSLEREARDLQDDAAAAAIPARVEAVSTWVRGRRVDVHGPRPCTGITAGLEANGFLRVQTGDGLVTVQTGGIRAAETN